MNLQKSFYLIIVLMIFVHCGKSNNELHEEANHHFELGNYSQCVTVCNQIDEKYKKFQEVSRLKNEATKILGYFDYYRKAKSKFDSRDFIKAKKLLDHIPLKYQDSLEDIRSLVKKIETETTRGFPLSDFIKRNATILKSDGPTPINKGVIHSVDLSANKLILKNTYDHRIKPNVFLLVLNKDGVTLLEHSENWVVDSLDCGEVSSTTYILKFRV